MKIHEFLFLVASMRAAQKFYFETRSPQALKDSKQIEKRVDAAIKEMYSTYKQPPLFK
jgi:hypothetical protein